MYRKKFKVSLRSALAIGLLMLSTLSFTRVFQSLNITEGTNQSYLIFDNGEVATTRSYFPANEDVKLIDASHMFILPRDVSYAAANYLVDKDGEIYTMDAHGYMYHKEFYFIDSKIKYYGGNYFVTKKGQFHIIKNDGMIINYDGLFNEEDDITRLSVVGGNYFVTKNGKLYVITDNGYYYDKTALMDFEPSDVKITGNNYLITKDGVVYTFGTEVVAQLDESGNIISDDNGRPIPLLDVNGQRQYYAVVYKYEQANYQSIGKVGGNFFIDTEKYIHTIANNGVLDRGMVGRKLTVKLQEDQDRGNELPVHIGNNYFIYEDGAMYMVDREGYYYFLKKLDRRVSQTNFEHKVKKKKIKDE